MRKYLYNYQTIVRFSNPIAHHQIMLRCQPATNEFQQSVDEHLILPPKFKLSKSRDCFGNRIIYGGTREDHSVLAYVSAGIMRCDKYAIQSEVVRNCYAQPTSLTAFTAQMESIMPVVNGNAEMQALDLCHSVHEAISYEPDHTDVSTTAARVMQLGKGVCQDMAHLMIALCRMRGISARYVNGFVEGMGATHAWVEVACHANGKDVWVGFDPTHDRKIDYGYIKLSHGRDANDCTVSRGTYLGNVIQDTKINVILQEI